MIADISYAARRLRNRPTYAVLAILTLALGVGGTAAVYGIARRLLLEPLPYAHEREVVTFWNPFDWSEEEFLYLRGKFPGFRDVAAYMPHDVTLREGDAAAKLVPGVATTAELFDVLGAQPALGRTFRAGEDLKGTDPEAVLSYGLWQELGGDAAIVGKRVTLDGVPRTVVGVMPRGFWFPSPAARVWITTALDPTNGSGNYALVGRVGAGHDARNMQGPAAALARMLVPRFHYSEQWDKTKHAKLTPIRDDLLGTIRPALLATLGAMGLILLIACANVAALMLGQVEARAGELAVRSALGANQTRLARQLVIEALLVGVGAAALGAALATGGFKVLANALPLGAWAEGAAPDWRLFVAAGAIAIVAALLVVGVPTLSLWRGDLRGVIGRTRTGGLEGRGGRLENGLVVAEVALAVLIASGAALLVRSVRNLYAVDPGLDASPVAVLDLTGSAEERPGRQWRHVNDVMDALRALPGVRTVGATHRLPLRGGGDNWGLAIEGRDARGEEGTTYMRVVSSDYFASMGVRVLAGRAFDATDRAAADSASARRAAGDTTPVERAAVINAAFAKKYFPNESPIGHRIGGDFRGWARIVGVVNDVAEGKLTDPAGPARYYLSDQVPYARGAFAVTMRVAPGVDPASVLDAARHTAERVAPSLAVGGTTTMRSVFDTAVGPARQVMSLLALLTALALVLGAVGIYGVVAHFAARRQRDWAIRVALGLRGSRVVALVVGHGAALVGVGVAIGVLGAIALSRLLASFLYGVSALDPVALGAAGLALLGVGVIAALFPARRAGMTDPALALREP